MNVHRGFDEPFRVEQEHELLVVMIR